MSETIIRPARAGDPVHDVIGAAFGEEGEKVAGVWADVAGSDLRRASLVAEEDGRLVGHVGLSHAWLDARPRLVDVWLLGPLGVLPARQGAGLGGRLLAAGVEAARAGGAPLVVLEGDPGYYADRGFGPAADLGIEPASARTPAPACQVVALEGYESWMRGRVVYPDVWWRHDAAGLRDPDLARIEAALAEG